MKSFLNYFARGLKAFKNFEAWFLILIGLAAYTARIPMPADGWFNLPLTVTVLQVGGLMFMLAGVQVFLSILMWPNVNLRDLLERAENGNIAAGLAAAGLMAFNGLSLLAQVLWLIYGSGARLGA
jgi:hypothetical protein